MGKMSLKSVVLPLVLLCSIVFSGCKKDYWEYDCGWVATDPQIELYKGCGGGNMTIDGVRYDFYTAQSNDAKDIEFYLDGTSTLLMKADTKLEREKLVLTITYDGVSSYTGEAIIFLKSE